METLNVGTATELAELADLARNGTSKAFGAKLKQLVHRVQGWRDVVPIIDPAVFDGLDADRTMILVERVSKIAERGPLYNSYRAAYTNIVKVLMNNVPVEARIERARTQLANASAEWMQWGANYLVDAVELLVEAGEPVDPKALATLRRCGSGDYAWLDVKRLTALVDDPILNVGEPWAERANADLVALDGDWAALVRHTRTATASKPTAAWRKRATALVAAIGDDDAVRDRVTGWLSHLNRSRTYEVTVSQYEPPSNLTIDPFNATALRGMIWLLGMLPARNTASTLADVVPVALRKVPGIGPRSPKLANAAVNALAGMDDPAALAQLARLASTVKFKGTLNIVNKALEKKAADLGVSRDEIEELAVPDFGLTEVGRHAVAFGDARAELTIVDGATALTWTSAAGKTVKSPPASVKRDHAEELKELKALAKDVGKMLTAQVERVDRQFLKRREWTLPSWRERYVEHPLLGTVGRRLIWSIDGTAVGLVDGKTVTVDDAPFTPDEDATVALWHPVDRDVDEILAWREWLERHRIRQPFKQAHREVYLLTEAEERTAVYSNRFAAHIVKQHQFHALTAARGWRDQLRLMVDDSYTAPHKDLPEWGLRAEFWVEGIGDEYGVDSTDSGTYLYLATDQVRFYPIEANQNWAHAGGGGYGQWHPPGDAPDEPLPIDRIPPLVLSEILRDVDLFVGVASIGNDPAWTDGGQQGRHVEYWESYSFGDLNAAAEIRRTLLERLLPRLAIADRVSIDGRFVVVRGDIRTYKIHIGSSNILMRPNDQYLCIVPNSRTAAADGNLFLPFEGDRTLSLILSKAMLLANDTAIEDTTITSQIGTRS